jgi:hypothetical protein
MADNLCYLYTEAPISATADYPDVPNPDSPLSPFLLAARWQSHDLYGEDMPRVAADLLEAGYDTPALRRLAGEIQVHSSSDVEPLVARMFHELGVAFPLSGVQARMVTTRQVAREVIAGLRNRWAAANYLEIVVWGWHAWHPADPNIAALFAINDEIDWDQSYRRSIDTLNREMLSLFALVARLTDSEIAEPGSPVSE